MKLKAVKIESATKTSKVEKLEIMSGTYEAYSNLFTKAANGPQVFVRFSPKNKTVEVFACKGSGKTWKSFSYEMGTLENHEEMVANAAKHFA